MIRIGLLFVFLLGINLFTGARNITDDIVSNQSQQNSNSRYCIVVGSFSSLGNAQKFGNSLKTKGYEAAYRKNETGFYRVCLFDFDTEQEAKKKIEEMKPKDALFKQVWILAYNNMSEKFTPKPVTTPKPETKTPVVEKIKPEPVQTKKSNLTAESPKVNKQAPVAEKVSKPLPKDEKTYARYCLVINRHPTVDAAREYGISLQSNGYSVFLRKEQDSSYIVCMYNLESKPDAEKRLDKMRHIDGIFTNAWIIGYDTPSENISVNQP